ncbi:carbohydrate ABC transporter permease [Alicyclobacillus tolerans]|uniref:carbohydrate ABC transporter permease n=1 Tax=Alicyclobacillus tolerans TaxID=90970 RepID=UPI001F2CA325|nr:carbohydrate ABC transporter permease [Alicyclobacillus tolerans]MCF8568005.1 carbohydrate ABC transporter permease [Alicyclobacillus tolerans]
MKTKFLPMTISYVWTLVFLSPFLWMVLTSFKSETAAYQFPPTIFFKPDFHHYLQFLTDHNFYHALVNSLVAAGGSVLVALVLGIPAAFSISTKSVNKQQNILFFLISTKMMPVVGIILSYYLLFKSLGLLDTRLALFFIYLTMALPMTIWLLNTYFRDLPQEVLEASKVDGASNLMMLFKVVIPMSIPGIVTAGLLSFVLNWNELFFALNITYTHATTLAVLVASNVTTEGLFWARLSALSVLVTIVPIIAGLIVQRHIVKGFTMGALK